MAINKLPALLLVFVLLFSAAAAAHAETANESYTVAQAESLCDGIVAYKGYGSAQSFIDDYLCANAGSTAEFYAISLSQLGDYDFSGYERALKSYLNTHEVYSATSREKYALALSAAGSTDRYIADTADEAIGGLGIMSLVFGLHLLNNGYESALYSVDGLISDILSYEMDGGGWAVMGSRGDVDVTAMTVQALAPYYGGRGDLTAAVDRAIELLSDKQLDSGGFKTMGAENCESAAQVIIALSALGIDAQTDDRFIKNGNSAMTGMMQYCLSDGSFAHTGCSSNESATIEAFCALTAYRRMCYGQSSLYILDHAIHTSPASDSGADKNEPDNSGSPSSRSGGSGSGSKSNGSGGSGGNGNSGAAGSSGGGAETDSNGNRIIIIDGRRYIEATTATGEKMTVSVSEDESEAVSPEHGQSAVTKPTHGGFQPSATEDTVRKTATADEASAGGGYKLYVIIGILAAGGIACAVLFLMKKRGMKHYIVVAALTAAGIVFILLTDFKTADSYVQPADTDGELTVTLSIRCDTITGKEKVNYYIPDDGTVLDTATYTADEGDTVYDVLIQAARANNIQLDNRGGPGAAYIAGINSLYEFDYGDLSGWMYRVNGEFPDVGCQSCTVSDGDVIEWLYTTNIGKDL